MLGRTNTGGGGGGLNFRVIGSTIQPTSAKENDIWINTSTKIEGRIFSATEPAPVPGMVWIPVGVASGAAFNALKKNSIFVYPTGCKQYIGGSFKNVGASIYINGWIQFAFEREYLYNNGETSVDWTGSGTDTDTALVMATKHGSHSGSYSSNGWKSSADTVTVPNGATKLCMRYSVSYSEGASSNLSYAYLGLSNSVYSAYPGKNTTEFVAYTEIERTGSDIIAEMPVTDALHGNSYDVGIKAGPSSDNVKVTSNWTITEIWFE